MRRVAAIVAVLVLSACSAPSESPAPDAGTRTTDPASERTDATDRDIDYRARERPLRCARDRRDRRFSVPPTVPGRWLECSSSGDGAASFVPMSGPRRTPLATLRHNIRALVTVPRDRAKAGWLSGLEGEPDVVRTVRVRDDGVVVVDVTDRVRSLVDLHGGGRITDMEEQLLRAVVTYDRSATLELTLDGSCAAYGDELISTEQIPQGCVRRTRADLQPAAGRR